MATGTTRSLKDEVKTGELVGASKNNSLAVNEVPEFLRESTTVRGTEAITSDKMVVPRVGICQTNSEQRKSSNKNYIENLVEGMLFNSLLGTIYDRPLKFIPLFFSVSRIHFKPLADGGGIICQAPDGVSCQLNNGGPCLHAKWGPNGEKPLCSEFYNFPVMLPDYRMELIVLSFKSTGINAAKQLNSFIRYRQKDAFAGVYVLDTFHKVDGQKDWWEPLITNAGWVDQVQFKSAEATYNGLFSKMKSGEVVFDAERGDDAAFAGRDSAEM